MCSVSRRRPPLRRSTRPGSASALEPPGRGTLLPREAYVDPAVLEWERAHFFAGWVCVGPVDRPGRGRAPSAPWRSARAAPCSPAPRTACCTPSPTSAGIAAHELLPCGADARKRAIVCPYHAWSYRLDGSLLGAPGFRDVDGFEPAGLGLVGLPCREWHGWVFVDSSGRAGDFDEHVGALEEIVAPYDRPGSQVLATHEYEIAANWKVVVENYQECYHCSMIHPELCQVSPPDSGSNLDLPGDWVGGWMDLRAEADTMSLDGAPAAWSSTGCPTPSGAP